MMIFKNLITYWFKQKTGLRFILTGGFNTLIGLIVFSSLVVILGSLIAEGWILALQYTLTIPISILTMKYGVFQSSKPFLKELLKGSLSYILSFLCNYILLELGKNLFITFLNNSLDYKLQIIGVQIIATGITTIFTYFLHKFFSFK